MWYLDQGPDLEPVSSYEGRGKPPEKDPRSCFSGAALKASSCVLPPITASEDWRRQDGRVTDAEEKEGVTKGVTVTGR